MTKLLLFGYGNPGRGDDSLGPLLVESIQQLSFLHIVKLVDMQLLIEHATDLTGFEQILFVDADVSCEAPFEFSTITAEKDSSYTSHRLSPAALLFIYEHIYRCNAPPSCLLRIRGYHFELGSNLSTQAHANLHAALRYVQNTLMGFHPST
ncbi:MAG TPA: hydrogenase maturation protease [Nitrosomonas sp.]|nr:hydrogenase maturation protease [Nitrosomonas sp.]